jgi:hypothetical protein
MFVDLLLVVGGPGTEFWRAELAWVVVAVVDSRISLRAYSKMCVVWGAQDSGTRV